MFTIAMLIFTFYGGLHIQRAWLLGMPVFARVIGVSQSISLLFALNRHSWVLGFCWEPAQMLSGSACLLMYWSIRQWEAYGGNAEALMGAKK